MENSEHSLFFSPREKFLVLIADVFIYLLISAAQVTIFKDIQAVSFLLVSPGYWFVVFSLALLSYLFGAYDFSDDSKFHDWLVKFLLIGSCSVLVVVFVNYVGAKERSGVFSRPQLFGTLALYLPVICLFHDRLQRRLIKRIRKSKFLVLCQQEDRSEIEKDLRPLLSVADVVFLFKPFDSEQLKEFLSQDWDFVFLGVSSSDLGSEITSQILVDRFQGKYVKDLLQIYEKMLFKLPVFYLTTNGLSLSDGFRLVSGGFWVRLKRLTDLLVAVVLFIIFLPFFLILPILIRWDSAGSVFYSQTRVGKNKWLFKVFKYRSMRMDAEVNGPQWAQQKDQRVTFLGRFLRKSRLDEIPQLWNILKGDMSLIGPRPERPEFVDQLEKQIPFYHLRHVVRPGLTGWAQVNYPYGSSIREAQEKLQYDLYYIKNYNPLLDLQILFKTVRVVLFQRGR